MIEVRKSLMAPFCEANVRAAREIYKHCPDCGGHTRMLVIRPNSNVAVAQGQAPGPLPGPPPAQIFFCDRCALAFLVVYDPSQAVGIEQGLPQLLQSAGLLVQKW